MAATRTGDDDSSDRETVHGVVPRQVDTSDHESTADEPTPEGKSRWRLALPALLFAGGFAAVLVTLHATGVLDRVYDRDALRQSVARQGALAPLFYLLFLVCRPFTLLPSTLFAPVAYALFGIVEGALLKACGESIGATLAMLASRHGLRSSLTRAMEPHGDDPSRFARFGRRLGRMLEHRGLRTVLALRLNLLIPFDVVNYGLGLTRVRVWTFFGATLVGILPGTFLYVALAGGALEGQAWMIAFSLAALAVMVWLSIPLARELLGTRESPRTQERIETVERLDDEPEHRSGRR
ncbi:MAG: TVP38/TMEM64 family protein [Planctomycetes bacterium]|nr:TVP38/TMEM64 family protein [Planctomycetota bacterium]